MDCSVRCKKLPSVGGVVIGTSFNQNNRLCNYVELTYNKLPSRMLQTYRARMYLTESITDVSYLDIQRVTRTDQTNVISLCNRWRNRNHDILPIRSISFSINRYGEVLATYLMVNLSDCIDTIVKNQYTWNKNDYMKSLAYVKYFSQLKLKIGRDNKELTKYKIIKLVSAIVCLKQHIENCRTEYDV